MSNERAEKVSEHNEIEVLRRDLSRLQERVTTLEDIVRQLQRNQPRPGLARV